MKSLKEKFLHILDVRWYLPFIIAFCFLIFQVFISFYFSDYSWFSSSQLRVRNMIIVYINILLLFFLIVSLIYQLSKRRWLRALITIVYSYLHFGMSFLIFALMMSAPGSILSNLDPCICKNAKEGSYITEFCKNHVESLSEEEKNKWIEDRKNCEKSDENNNRDNGSVVPN